MAVALYRVNFMLRGSARSLLKQLPEPPEPGDRLTLENIVLRVARVEQTPGSSVAATVEAIVEHGTDD